MSESNSTASPILVPYNLEAEQAVLGGIMISPHVLGELNLKASDFYFHRHGIIYTSCMRLAKRGVTIDLISLADDLENQSELTEIGGLAYLTELTTVTPNSLNAVSHARIVQQHAERRGLIAIANKIAKAAYDPETPVTEAQTLALESLANVGMQPNGAVHISEWIAEAISEIEHRKASGAQDYKIPTGFLDLDRLIEGLYPDDGTMLILSGREGTGKTILAQNMAETFQGYGPGVIYSMEMGRLRMSLRFLSQASDLSVNDMRTGRIEDHELAALLDHDFTDRQIWVSDGRGWGTGALRADLARLKHERGIRWYALDYMGLLRDQMPSNTKGWEKAGTLSRRLLRINRELGLASVIIHTLNKSGELAGDASVGYDCDIHVAMERSQSAPGVVDLHIKKNRDGEQPLGTINLIAPQDTPEFRDAVPQRDRGMYPVNGSRVGGHQ